MFAYVVKRILIMIPTFAGVSIAIWLVMTMAPGRPTGKQSAGFGEGADTEKLGNLAEKNVSERMFRHQFGLNRPRFINTWTGIDPDDLQESLKVVREGQKQHGIANVRDASEALEDYGPYAIPALVDLLQTTKGAEQQTVLFWLRRSAYVFPKIRAQGEQRSDAEVARDRDVQLENQRLDSPELNWASEATPDERAWVVSNWKKWFAEQSAKGRWSFRDSFWERVWVGLTDTQFGHYWSNLATFDFGNSFKSNEPVWELITAKLKYSLSLALPAFFIAWILAVFLGVTSAANHNKPIDQGLGIGLFMLYSIPSFLMATVVQRAFAVDLGWFPVDRWESVGAQSMNTWEQFLDVLKHLWLPLFCYTYGSLAFISRQARSGMLEVLQSDYIRTARAKGVGRTAVLWKHAVRNGMMPLITLLGTALPVLLGGSVVIESIFNIPGFGKAMLDAILSKDYNVVMGISLLSAALTLVGLLIADLLYAAVDPRVSFE